MHFCRKFLISIDNTKKKRQIVNNTSYNLSVLKKLKPAMYILHVGLDINTCIHINFFHVEKNLKRHT